MAKSKLDRLFGEAVEARIKSMGALTLEAVKVEIRSNLRQIAQWDSFDQINAKAKYYYKLESLVELLEVFECGSVGGFGTGQSRDKHYSLKERAEYVLNLGS